MSAGCPVRLNDGRCAALERIPSSLSDSDLSTYQTIQRMCRHIRAAQTDPLLRKIAAHLASRSTCRCHGARQLVWDVWHLLKTAVRFRSDEDAVLKMLNETDQVDFLISPSVLVRMPRPEGDCDDLTMLGVSLLTLNGVPCALETLKCDPRRPGQWSHVFARVFLPDRATALDAIPSATYCGWEVPAAEVTQRQMWSLDGSPLPTPQGNKVVDMRLHGYVRRRGMGQTDPQYEATGIPSYVGTPTSTVSTSSFDWGSFINKLSDIGSKLGTIALTPRGAYVTPQGLVVNNPYAIPPVSASAQLGGVSGTALLVGGIAIFGLILIAGMSKK